MVPRTTNSVPRPPSQNPHATVTTVAASVFMKRVYARSVGLDDAVADRRADGIRCYERSNSGTRLGRGTLSAVGRVRGWRRRVNRAIAWTAMACSVVWIVLLFLPQ